MLDKIKNLFYRISQRSSRVKVPTILQMEATECGAASLAMILAHYGLWIPLEKIRQECGVNRDGSKANCVLKAARNRNCIAKGFRWSADKLLTKTAEDFPLIIHWEFNHFVVLEGIVNGIAYLNDPAMGRRQIPFDEFKTSYTGIALSVKPDTNFKKEGHRYNIVKAVAEKLIQDKWAMLFIILIGLGMIFPGLASPVFSQIFLDEILTGKHSDWMIKLLIAMGLSFVLSGLMSWLRAVVLTRWQEKLTLSDSSSFFWHVLRLPIQFFQQRFAAEIASRISFNESIAGFLSSSAATAVLDFFVALFYLLLLLQYSVTLTIIGVGFSLIDLIVFLLMRRKLTDMNMKIQQDQGKEYGTAMNGLMMIETIKANGNETDFFSKWAGYRAKVLISTQEVQLWSLTASILPTLLSGMNSAIIMTVGGFSIMEGVMTAGIFMAFQNLMDSFQGPFNNLINLGSTLQTTEMQMQRLDDVRRYDIDRLNYPDENAKMNFKGDRLSGELEFKNINFGYSPLEPPLIENFNLHLDPGRWVAVVGFSGSGKSTLAKIVTGLYEEWSGEVLFDGVKRREIPHSVIVNSIASVDQDIFQITGTIRENISLFDDSIRRNDIIQAAKDACIHEDILKLNGGYEAQVEEGGMNFSGGQRQRLEIARALAVNPSLLILDEATSALDPMTEQIVLENIRRRGCSCFIVAHRLSTIRDADEIIVLDRGKVVERGTHREMMQHDGAYRRLLSENESTVNNNENLND
ncbi:MAG: NHLP family bacteriocin export ABC transporter peptidase/permease/ATPase subunit [Selenomonadaceae bacterium]|nr:NHLP family bacteriocin export ABC transporter peptidase/permease/ATPase subunit [Selenomonadaceae bacterium]